MVPKASEIFRPGNGTDLNTIPAAYQARRLWIAEANRLRAELPDETREVLTAHEAAGTTGSQEYADAMMVFYRRHVCRMDPWPDCLNRSLELMIGNPEVYNTMWGASEFYMTGNLKNRDVTARLGEIGVPALITSGRHDEATPAIAESLRRGIPQSQQVIFERSAHAAHIEEAEQYRLVVDNFLNDVEKMQPMIASP